MNLDKYLPEVYDEKIEVINNYTKRSYGTITWSGEIIEEFNSDPDDCFSLEKLIIEDVNYDKKYEVGVNELRRLKLGDSIVKGCVYAGCRGTTLVFLRFKCVGV